MSDARNAILRRVRAAATNPLLASDRERSVPRRQVAAFDPRELVTAWQHELRQLGCHTYGPCAPSAALEELIALAHSRGEGQVLAWHDPQLPLAIAEPMRQAGINLVQPRTPAEASDRQGLGQIRLGVSGALAGFADTGSILVASGVGRPRSVSLLPPVLVALLRVSDLYPSLADWMALHGRETLCNQANVMAITGPSRTADIELTLVVGVHGPGEVHAILLDI